ncbi:MAG: hypothetical protein IT231_04455, partial [Flavobacteriales bacterium]|nr:hypothetical protein [Flavobacteriales bacterium]
MNCRPYSTPPCRTWGWLKSGLLGAAMVLFGTAQAQVSNYAFSQSVGTYTATSGAATQIIAPNIDDGNSAATNIGFSFTYNGSPFTQFVANSNGHIRLGGTAPTGSYTPLSTASNTNAISLLGRDGRSIDGVFVETTGAPGSQVCVIEFRTQQLQYNVTTSRMTGQIRLYEASGVVEMVYGTGIQGATYTPQVGLRGGTGTTDFNNRTTTTDWAATTAGATSSATCTYSTTSYPASGQTFTWTPPVPCSSVNAGAAVASVTSGCGTVASSTLSLSGATSGVTGLTYQWYSGPVGGPYLTPLGTASTESVNGLVSTTAYVCTVTCTNGGATATSSEAVITVNTVPTVVASATDPGPFCGTANTDLNATGADTYTWSPATGLSAATGTPVSCTATSTTTYTVTGTVTATGCTGNTTIVVTVNPAPIISSVTANPNPTCFNGNSQLNAISFEPKPANLMVFGAGTGSLDPMTGATTVLTTSNDDSPSGLQNIGFTFLFNGVNYTQWSCTPDGFLKLGTPVATADFSNGISENTNMPKIMPYYDDMATGTTGNVTSVVTGTAPNRILVVQWFVTIPRATGGAANSTFQCWLHETTGAIEFHYGTMGPGAMSASVGIAASTTNYQSVTITGATVSTVAANDVNGDQPASGTMYSFTNPPPASLLWTPNTFLNFDNIANPMASGVNVASQAYTVTATASNGCTSTGNVTVNTSAPITAASITGTLAFSTGGSTTLTAVPADGGGPFTYLWSPGGETTASIVVTTAGSYSCQVSDACGGSVNTGSVSVVENFLPTVVVDVPSANYCTGNPSIAITASGASTYAWSPAAGLDATNVAAVNANPTSSTTYTVTGTDGNGCQNTATSAITVLGAIPVINSTTATPPTVCIGGNSQLQVNVPGPGSYCNSNFTSVTYEFLTNVTFGGINNTSAGNAGGPVDYTAQVASVTAGTSYNLDVTMDPDALDYIYAFFDWNQNGVLNDVGEAFTVVASSNVAGPHTISIPVPANATNGNTRMRVMVDYSNSTPNPCRIANFGEAEDYTVNVSGGNDAYTFSWTPATYLSSTTIANPMANGVTPPVAYTVTVTNAAGCSADGTVSVTLDNTDTDSDGTPDCTDGCPTDPLKIAPGICGCGVADTDTDSDGTADCNDGCPSDPLKTAAGICGCGVADTDSDSDGTADCNDGCPLDPLKTAAGICGCGVADTDSDSDGTADCIDGCPADPLKIAAGQCGCGVADTDSDNDGTADCNDLCPADPAKTAPGQCGCGVADTDSDSDGTADCNDLCPADPAKTAPGICGCGVADTDSDNDGTADCNDLCPADPLKIAPGQCGCGVADTDSDSDGTADCNDGCPADPLKIAAGLCGCGIPEGTCNDCLGVPAGPAQPGTPCDDLDDCTTGDIWSPLCVCTGTFQDTDSDGTCDANDGCPSDPNKITAGVCGCGVVDTDTDSDGTADCNDGCPLDPLKTAAGICGCGVADTDSDSDGTADCIDG